MKKTILSILSAALLLATVGCNTERITGSGTIITETRAVSDFSEVEADDALDLVITEGTEHSLIIEADDNVVDRVQTSISGKRVKIEMEGINVSYNNTSIRVFIEMPALNVIKLNDASEANVSGFSNMGELEINLNDASELKLVGEAVLLTANIKDASQVNAFDFTAQTCIVDLKDASDLDIYCTDLIEGTLKDASTLRYQGNPVITATTSDASDIINAN